MTPRTHEQVQRLSAENARLEEQLEEARNQLLLWEQQRVPSKSSPDPTEGSAEPPQGLPTPTSVAPTVEGLTRPPALRTATYPTTEDKHKPTLVATSSTSSANSWQRVDSNQKNDKKELNETSPGDGGESAYAFEDALSTDPSMVHITGEEF